MGHHPSDPRLLHSVTVTEYVRYAQEYAQDEGKQRAWSCDFQCSGKHVAQGLSQRQSLSAQRHRNIRQERVGEEQRGQGLGRWGGSL